MSSGGTETPSPALAGRAPSCRLSCPETLALASQGMSVSDLRSQPTLELSLGLNYNLPLLGLLMSCTTDVPWPGRQMGFSFLQELASWTQGWVWEGRISHGQREHGGTFSPKLYSTLGLDHQLANLNSTLVRMVFKWGENKDTNREETGQGGICALEVKGGYERLSLCSVCLRYFTRHSSQGLIVVIRVKILAFPETSPRPASRGSLLPHVVVSLRQVGSENN